MTFRGPIWVPKVSFWGFWGLVCIEKWSQNFDSGTRSAIFGTPKNQNSESTFINPNPQKGTLGTQIGPRKVIFSHFIDFGHFPIEIPIEVEKNYLHGKERS